MNQQGEEVATYPLAAAQQEKEKAP